jgi:3',5'-cyclic AMP phosphodiesterase CpdA
MRIAVFSDVHADLSALELVLAAIERAQSDAIWCVGDIVGLGGDAPAEVLDLVRARSALVLAGNHDRWFTGTLPLDMLPLPRERVELKSQRAQLSSERLKWLAGLPAHTRRGGIGLWSLSLRGSPRPLGQRDHLCLSNALWRRAVREPVLAHYGTPLSAQTSVEMAILLAPALHVTTYDAGLRIGLSPAGSPVPCWCP